MYKSGLIVGIVTLLLALGTTLVFPFCVPCLALLVGLAAGYLAGVFEKPVSLEAARKNGAIAGSACAIQRIWKIWNTSLRCTMLCTPGAASR